MNFVFKGTNPQSQPYSIYQRGGYFYTFFNGQKHCTDDIDSAHSIAKGKRPKYSRRCCQIS